MLDPFNVDADRQVAGDPHQEHQHDTDREWEAQVIVSVFCGLRLSGESARADKWQQQSLAEADI
jgi:hypothetical protein